MAHPNQLYDINAQNQAYYQFNGVQFNPQQYQILTQQMQASNYQIQCLQQQMHFVIQQKEALITKQQVQQQEIQQRDNKIKDYEQRNNKTEQELENYEIQERRIRREFRIQIDDLQNKVQDKDEELRELGEKYKRLQKEKTDNQNVIAGLNNKIKNQENLLNEKEDEINFQKNDLKRLEQQIQTQTGKQPDIDRQFQHLNEQFSTEKKTHQQQITQLKKQFEEQINKLNENIEQKELENQALQSEKEKEHKYFIDARDEITKFQKRLQQLQIDLNIKDQSINNLEKRLRELSFNYEQEKLKLKSSEEEIASQRIQQDQIINQYKQYIKFLESNSKPDNKSKQEFEKNLQQLQNEIQQNIQQQKEKAQKEEKQKQLDYEQNINKQKMLEEKRQQNKQQENKLIKEMLIKRTKESLEEFGKLDICYVVDFTKSMEPYVEQARCCVTESLKIIKQQTNRDTIISSIAFYDMEQKPPGGYHQFNFSNDVQAFQKFMQSVSIVGGQDPPEDVKGALQQMVEKLKWMNKFKIAILITDSPCHGKKYHSLNTDFHPNDDITEMIHQLIEKQIILIGFNLNQKTIMMYEEFKKIYEAKNASDLFLYVDVAGLSVNQLSEKMAKSLGSASVNATQVKSQGTKTKNPQQQKERPKNKDGAMEALCKQGDFYNFELKIPIVDTEFTVLNVTINDQEFAKNLKSINFIGRDQKRDYAIKDEGKWQCIRTTDPFAFGMMKDVFLMKKKNGGPEELYVIKTPLGGQPYQSQGQAIQECRSHLICQQLMKKFKSDIQDAKEEQKFLDFKYPNVIYSDFLILKEKEDRFWIAERFFKGEFVKYNNNYGYINEEITEINKFAQAFSYYTFFVSGGNYMVNDVQGVGTYFTDPAINTISGDFDETDLGEEGMKMYLVNFQSKKTLPFEILQLLNVLVEY